MTERLSTRRIHMNPCELTFREPFTAVLTHRFHWESTLFWLEAAKHRWFPCFLGEQRTEGMRHKVGFWYMLKVSRAWDAMWPLQHGSLALAGWRIWQLQIRGWVECSEGSLAVEAVTAHPDSRGSAAYLSRAGVAKSHCGGAGRVEDFAVTISEKMSSVRGTVLKFYPLLFQNHLQKMTQLGEEF